MGRVNSKVKVIVNMIKGFMIGSLSWGWLVGVSFLDDRCPYAVCNNVLGDSMFTEFP